MKGNVKNHMKEGEWEEKKYIYKFDKPVWINGNYINGLKDGEWYYSPNGPAEMVEFYKEGKLISSSKL